MDADSAIPLIDFDQFLNGSTDQREQVASAIDAAFRSVGFLYVSNHGIDQDKVDECFQWVTARLPSSYVVTQGAFHSSLISWLPFPRRRPFSTSWSLRSFALTLIANASSRTEQALLCAF